MQRNGLVGVCLLGTSFFLLMGQGRAGDPKGKGLPVLVKEDFEKGATRWQPADPTGWKVEKFNGGHVYHQFTKKSSYKPPHRAPFHMALLKDVKVGSFQLDARVKSTIPDYGHRDACVFFGYQDSGHLYYVHFGKKTDDHANQIFIVNGADRKKISTKTTAGTNWDDEWHHVRVVRDADSGKIEVFFDDMQSPVMVASDRTFIWGQVGFGSFDDTTMWDDVVLRGVEVKSKAK
jgi:hypothetical protein